MLGRLRMQVLMAEGFDLKYFKAFPFKKNKIILISNQLFLFWTVKLSVFVQFDLFPGVRKVRVYSYTSVQWLLIPNLLCLKPCAWVSDHRSPRLLATGGGWSVHICLWLLKGFISYCKNSATVNLIYSEKLHVLIACDHSKLHLPFVIHISVPRRTWRGRWMFRLCRHDNMTSISVLLFQLNLFNFLWISWMKLAFGCVLYKSFVEYCSYCK